MSRLEHAIAVAFVAAWLTVSGALTWAVCDAPPVPEEPECWLCESLDQDLAAWRAVDACRKAAR